MGVAPGGGNVRSLILLAFLPLMLAASPASAQPAADPAACAAIGDDAERLACYDAIFRNGPGVDPATTVVIESNFPIPARPTGRGPATMEVSCTAGTLGVRFTFAGQLLSETGDDAGISFQVQQTGNVVRNLPVADDNKSVIFPSETQADTFLESIEGGDSLIVRITPPRQRSLQVEFDLKTHTEDIGRIRELCR
jgi:type VI secretion system protein VasI